MRWDLGLQGVAVLIAMSIGFGAFAHVMLRSRTTRWVWLIASAACFVAGLLISEVLFGWATGEELQPNIDGLSFDEVLLGTFLGAAVVVGIWYLRRPRRLRPSGSS